ncbi:MAG TPA: hypothetical protein VMM58_06360 [Bacteroidota bacterium]|nr:hypothetical protein [Bacteroidota bacterium]
MDQIIELHRSARNEKILLLNDIFPAIILFGSGVQTLLSEGSTKVALINIVSGGLILVFGTREWRALSKHHHRRIQWYDVASGVVMLLNVYSMYKPWKGFQPADLYLALALFLLLRGFSIIRLPHRRKLTLSENEFTIRTRPLSFLRCSWKDVEKISMENSTLVVLTSTGKKKISLRQIENKDDAYLALQAFFEGRTAQ